MNLRIYAGGIKSEVHVGLNTYTFVQSTNRWIGIGYVGNPPLSKSFTIEWAKLELGSAATPFIPPNSTLELLKCQRYYQRLTGQMLHVGTGYASSAGTESFTFMGFCPLPTTMRIVTPTVAIHGQLHLWIGGYYGSSSFTTNRLVGDTSASNLLRMPLGVDSTDVELNRSLLNLPGSMQFRDTESYIEISADL